MTLEEKAEYYFQDKLSKFAVNRKPHSGFVSLPYERAMYIAGFMEAVRMLRSDECQKAMFWESPMDFISEGFMSPDHVADWIISQIEPKDCSV